MRAVLQTHYLEKVPEVMFRYQMMRSLERRSDPSFAPKPEGAAEHVGFGA